jgi:amidase
VSARAQPLEHTAGGSSGGAGAALAAGLGCLAQGSDGGGSIRIPSACCGVVGLKPSRGRVTMAPMLGEAWAGFATAGPMARTVRDTAMFMDVLAGHVPGDPYWAPDPVTSFRSAVRIPPKSMRIAMLKRSAITRGDAESEAATEAAAKVLEELGHRVEQVDVDPAARLRDVCMTLICAGISSIPIEKPELMDPVIRYAWERGRKIAAHEYITTVGQMHSIAREVVQSLDAYDAIISPTIARPAVRIGTLPSKPENYLEELPEFIPYTFPFNATGQPGFSLPNGFSKAGLPIGLQIVGRQADEVAIIGLAQQFEEARPWKDKHPALD